MITSLPTSPPLRHRRGGGFCAALHPGSSTSLAPAQTDAAASGCRSTSPSPPWASSPASLAVRPAALGLAFWAQAHSFGLLHLLALPFWAEVAVGVLWLDLTFYYWHRFNHLRPLLWRFHNVHHVDPDMDVTTSFRFHFGEVLYSTPFRVLQVGLLGISPVTYLLYEFLFNCATMFHHSNVRLPLALERLLNKIFVTPRMHGIHHSALGPETNSNYSVVFSAGTG